MTIIIDSIQKRSEKFQEKTSRNDHQFQQSVAIHNNFFFTKTFLYTNNKHGEKKLMEINSVKTIHNWLKYGECLNLNLHPRLI